MRSPLVLLLVLASCRSHDPPAPAPDPVPEPEPAPATTPNQFLQRGTPTFILGTAGDDLADRGVAAQVGLVHEFLFPQAAVVRDTDVTDWPANPVVYGGPHVNALVATLALPFTLAPGRLEIGGATFTGDDIQLITVVPAAADHPELLLYAGTGTPGVGEINARAGGGAAITIKDAFGILQTGTWKRGAAVLDPPAARASWRSTAAGDVTIRTLSDLDPAVRDAALRGIATAQAALRAGPQPMTLYIYPDAATKQRITGDGGDGTAIVEARALHVIAVAPAQLEHLVAHEATHVLGYHTWGAAGSPLLGEGLAVWAAGTYQGRGLGEWARRFRATTPDVTDLMMRFRKLPEPDAYPLGGLLVATLVDLVGLDAVRAHLYPAAPSQWDAACTAAGTSAATVQEAFVARILR